jgi:hypothetical protein
MYASLGKERVYGSLNRDTLSSRSLSNAVSPHTGSLASGVLINTSLQGGDLRPAPGLSARWGGGRPRWGFFCCVAGPT